MSETIKVENKFKKFVAFYRPYNLPVAILARVTNIASGKYVIIYREKDGHSGAVVSKGELFKSNSKNMEIMDRVYIKKTEMEEARKEMNRLLADLDPITTEGGI
jgi:hypothetical protein